MLNTIFFRWVNMASLCSVPCALNPSFDLCRSNYSMFHWWNGSLPPLSCLFPLSCYYLFMSAFHSLPPTHILLSITLGKPVHGHFSCLLSHGTTPGLEQTQYGFISVLPSSAASDTQGFPELMHCKFPLNNEFAWEGSKAWIWSVPCRGMPGTQMQRRH